MFLLTLLFDLLHVYNKKKEREYFDVIVGKTNIKSNPINWPISLINRLLTASSLAKCCVHDFY